MDMVGRTQTVLEVPQIMKFITRETNKQITPKDQGSR